MSAEREAARALVAFCEKVAQAAFDLGLDSGKGSIVLVTKQELVARLLAEPEGVALADAARRGAECVGAQEAWTAADVRADAGSFYLRKQRAEYVGGPVRRVLVLAPEEGS